MVIKSLNEKKFIYYNFEPAMTKEMLTDTIQGVENAGH